MSLKESNKKYSNLTPEQIAKLKKLMKAGKSPIAEKEFQKNLKNLQIEKIRKEHSEHYGFKELMLEQDYTGCLTHNLWERFMQREYNLTEKY